mmetsp:Transcript_24324/g.48513  ORF Transcript_24324/g.48513 Transcript_24324/m.48513 type:complete len:186 (-) Transcript_24324:187-744(-)
MYRIRSRYPRSIPFVVVIKHRSNGQIESKRKRRSSPFDEIPDGSACSVSLFSQREGVEFADVVMRDGCASLCIMVIRWRVRVCGSILVPRLRLIVVGTEMDLRSGGSEVLEPSGFDSDSVKHDDIINISQRKIMEFSILLIGRLSLYLLSSSLYLVLVQLITAESLRETSLNEASHQVGFSHNTS